MTDENGCVCDVLEDVIFAFVVRGESGIEPQMLHAGLEPELEKKLQDLCQQIIDVLVENQVLEPEVVWQ